MWSSSLIYKFNQKETHGRAGEAQMFPSTGIIQMLQPQLLPSFHLITVWLQNWIISSVISRDTTPVKASELITNPHLNVFSDTYCSVIEYMLMSQETFFFTCCSSGELKRFFSLTWHFQCRVSTDRHRTSSLPRMKSYSDVTPLTLYLSLSHPLSFFPCLSRPHNSRGGLTFDYK